MFHDEPKSFLEHLEDLRRTLFKSVTALAIGMVVCMPLAPRIFGWLKRPLSAVTTESDVFLRSLEVTGGFSLAAKIIVWCGILISSPAIIYFAMEFIVPGLNEKERKIMAPLFGAGMALFFFGAAIGYWITLPVALKVMHGLHSWMGVSPEWTAGSYIVFSLHVMLAFGLAFELPILIVALGYMGVVSVAQLRAKRRHVIVGIFVLAMVLTPPEVVSQIIMALIMMLFYEICVLIVAVFERRRIPASF